MMLGAVVGEKTVGWCENEVPFASGMMNVHVCTLSINIVVLEEKYKNSEKNLRFI